MQGRGEYDGRRMGGLWADRQQYDSGMRGGTSTGMTSEDEAYWQTRLGERGGQLPDPRANRWRGQETRYGGGWAGPDREEYRSVYGRPDQAGMEGPHTGRGPKSYRRSDDRICEDICEALTEHGHIDASDIEVSVEQGVVTLQGMVDDRRQKRMAEECAEIVSGVVDVQNQIRVAQGAERQRREQMEGTRELERTTRLGSRTMARTP